jgi:hypothetical protein
MDPDAPWQGSPKAAPGKAVEAERDAASRSYVQRNGKTGTVDAKGRVRRSRNCRRQPGGTRVAHQGLLRVKLTRSPCRPLFAHSCRPHGLIPPREYLCRTVAPQGRNARIGSFELLGFLLRRFRMQAGYDRHRAPQLQIGCLLIEPKLHRPVNRALLV